MDMAIWTNPWYSRLADNHMQLTFDAPCVTRAELLAFSGFRLPHAAADVVVPPLSTERLRTAERYGLFDNVAGVWNGSNGATVQWVARRGRQGDARLYTIRHVAVARLIAWMQRDGLKIREIALILRGPASVAATLRASNAEAVYVYRVGESVADGACASMQMLKGMKPVDPAIGRQWLFPLAWLGMNGEVLPRVQKIRERKPYVWNRRPMTPAEIVTARLVEDRTK